MEKTYQPQQLEANWYKTWEERGYFAPQGDGDPYCIVIPPPMSPADCIWGMVSNTQSWTR